MIYIHIQYTYWEKCDLNFCCRYFGLKNNKIYKLREICGIIIWTSDWFHKKNRVRFLFSENEIKNENM